MTGESNKGRFKCPHEAQAVWNVFKEETLNFFNVNAFETHRSNGVLALESFANSLHKARLIHGSIYDEDGLIEDKDVAHSVAQRVVEISRQYLVSPSVDYIEDGMLKRGEIRGTIFY